MKHKHAELIMAIANGESPDDWECQPIGSTKWIGILIAGIIYHPDQYEVRRKQKTHIVNGFTVPAPEKHAPSTGVGYFVPCLDADGFYTSLHWDDASYDKMLLDRCLVHLSKEAAIANAKAMLSLDPNSDD